VQRTIVYILSTAYSGSSLLNSLLDAQPMTRGLGEAVHLLRKPTNAWCSHCKCHVDDCRLQASVHSERFYESIFEAYPDASVLVNSSKHWGHCFHNMPIPPQGYQIRLVVLSKSMVEFGHSFSTHNKCSFDESFRTWLEFYRYHLDNIEEILHGSTRREVHAELYDRFASEDVARVSYRDLASTPDETVQRLCNELRLPFDLNFRDKLWNGQTCTIGGNNAVYAQQSGNAAFFRDDSSYLDGKYAKRNGVVFYDDAYLTNGSLMAAASTYEAEHRDDLEPLRERLGQPVGT